MKADKTKALIYIKVKLPKKVFGHLMNKCYWNRYKWSCIWQLKLLELYFSKVLYIKYVYIKP